MISVERLQKNRTRIVWFVVLLSVLLFFEPFKVTNPTNPFFNPDRFRFSDYRDRESLSVAFRKLFPIGTSKNFVDRVLVDSGNAKSAPVTRHFQNIIIYSEPKKLLYPPGPAHTVIFDENGNVLNIAAFNTEYLYENQITTKQIFEEFEQKGR